MSGSGTSRTEEEAGKPKEINYDRAGMYFAHSVFEKQRKSGQLSPTTTTGCFINSSSTSTSNIIIPYQFNYCWQQIACLLALLHYLCGYGYIVNIIWISQRNGLSEREKVIKFSVLICSEWGCWPNPVYQPYCSHYTPYGTATRL